MWTMGKDNGYAFADLWYSNMDKLIQIMNEHERNDFKTIVFHVQTDIWILCGPDQKQIRVQTGSGRNSDFSFEIEKFEKTEN